GSGTPSSGREISGARTISADRSLAPWCWSALVLIESLYGTGVAERNSASGLNIVNCRVIPPFFAGKPGSFDAFHVCPASLHVRRRGRGDRAVATHLAGRLSEDRLRAAPRLVARALAERARAGRADL